MCVLIWLCYMCTFSRIVVMCIWALLMCWCVFVRVCENRSHYLSQSNDGVFILFTFQTGNHFRYMRLQIAIAIKFKHLDIHSCEFLSPECLIIFLLHLPAWLHMFTIYVYFFACWCVSIFINQLSNVSYINILK